MTTTATPAGAPWARVAAIALGLVAAVSTIVLAFLWPASTAEVKNLPVALVGQPAQVAAIEAALSEKAPGTFAFTEAADRDAAVELIESREVYGAIVIGRAPEVLTASAASPVVAQLLAGLAPVMQARIVAELAAQGIQPPAPIVVEVTDVAPLAEADSRGAVLAASSFPIVIGGLLGGIALSFAVASVWRRVAAVAIYSVGAGFALAGILQGVFGALQGDYLVQAMAISLAILSMAGVIVGLVSLLGRPGIPLGVVTFLLVANPISAAAQPVEFLAQPWGAVGQWFPPGAAATLLRDLSYFPAADATFPWLVLTAWAALGLALAALAAVTTERRAHRTAPAAEATPAVATPVETADSTA